MTNGYFRVAAVVPAVRVADIEFNAEQIIAMMARAEGQGVEVVCFPELCITAYTCQDLFANDLLLEQAEAGLLKVLEFSRSLPRLTAIVGLPVQHAGHLYNCAAVVHAGRLCGLVAKTYLPNYHEFYEKRWFDSALHLQPGAEVRICGDSVPLSANLLFRTDSYTFAIELCEDLWAVVPPASRHALCGADVVFNLSASNELIGKSAYLRSLVVGQSARLLCAYVYAACGFGESTQDLVFSGRTYIAENGHILAEGERFAMQPQLTVADIDVEALRHDRRVNTSFSTNSAEVMRAEGAGYRWIEMEEADPIADFVLQRTVDPLPFVPAGAALAERCEEILCIQSEALAGRIRHTGVKTVVLGISGGLDSTLALLVCVHAFDRLGLDRRGIIGITMPGYGTTDRTYTNAIQLMQGLQVTIREISIRDACTQHLRDLGHDGTTHDVTYENAQARERTQILMDAANQMGGFVVGTGDLSELALGWATYAGDHISMYGVNASIPKTLVRHLVTWVARNVADEYSAQTLLDIVDTPISPELIPADEQGQIVQKTEELVGPYELHDFFLYHTLRHGRRPARIFALARLAFDGHDERVPVYDADTIKHWMKVFYRRFFSQQFKRSCLPDGPKVGSCSLSPRGDLRMSSDTCAAIWMRECEALS